MSRAHRKSFPNAHPKNETGGSDRLVHLKMHSCPLRNLSTRKDTRAKSKGSSSFVSEVQNSVSNAQEQVPNMILLRHLLCSENSLRDPSNGETFFDRTIHSWLRFCHHDNYDNRFSHHENKDKAQCTWKNQSAFSTHGRADYRCSCAGIVKDLLEVH